MMKNSLKTRLKGSRGITLIALVISVIVLLILAGVSISAITGNESAMEKAKEAREKNEQGAELDSIKLAVVSAMANGDYTLMVNISSLRNGLTGLIKENPEEVITAGGTQWIVTGNTGMKYKIKQNGEVAPAEPVATVEFVKTEDSIEVGQSKKLAIVAKGASGNVTEANVVTFTSANTNVATVGEDGTISIPNDESLIDKTVKISVEADNISGSNECTITVKKFMPYAKDALVVTVTNEGTDSETVISEKYVNYTMSNGATTTCRVLYNDEQHGLQIIPVDVAKDTSNQNIIVTLGSEEPNVSDAEKEQLDADLTYKETSSFSNCTKEEFAKAKDSYNKMVTTLNNASSNLKNTNLSEYARCVGSKATKIPSYDDATYATIEDKGQSPYDKSYQETYGVFSDGYKKADTNYEEDQKRLTEINAWITNSTYFLASREVKADRDNTYFRVRRLDVSTGLSAYYLIKITNAGRANAQSPAIALRPIFYLKSNVKISGGEGTSANPYTLEAES